MSMRKIIISATDLSSTKWCD